MLNNDCLPKVEAVYNEEIPVKGIICAFINSECFTIKVQIPIIHSQTF